MQKIAHYNSDTGEFKKVSNSRENPREPGKFLIPANATELLPPGVYIDDHFVPDLSKNEVFVFENGAWIKKDDFRGQTIYLKDKSRPSLIVKTLGAISSEYTLLKPKENQVWVEGSNSWEYSLSLVKEAKIKKLFAYYEQKKNFPISFFCIIDNVEWTASFDLNDLATLNFYTQNVWDDFCLGNGAGAIKKVNIQLTQAHIAPIFKKKSLNWTARELHKKKILNFFAVTDVNDYDFTGIIEEVQIDNTVSAISIQDVFYK